MSLGLLSPPYPLFQWYLQSKEILLKTQHLMHKVLRLTIVVAQVGAVKIYVAAVEALRIKERQDETQFITKIGEKTSLSPKLFRFPLTSLMPYYAETSRSLPIFA